MELEFENKEGKLTVKVIGDLDTTTFSKLEEELSKNINDDTQEIIFNLEELKYISSAGIRVLVKTRKKISNMKVLKPTNEVMEVFEMTGLVKVLNIQK